MRGTDKLHGSFSATKQRENIGAKLRCMKHVDLKKVDQTNYMPQGFVTDSAAIGDDMNGQIARS
jgi:hypothetical protein